ncbi:SusE domain-containing protein [Pedobacter gandavensis]|uniref:SusE domain-containing protein n=1 Tax=Pedobacter TaxID=84567 RepID=UPI001C99AD8A|nr:MULTISPECIES: SusE domain-containing protein [Pedobacter]WGQ10969.1 SusE domain-containing protein [Pedobacter gandavensis]
MKINILSTACCLIVLLSIFGCKKDKEFKDVQITEVSTLYSPDDGKKMSLSSSGSLYFEWEKATALDNGVVYYDVIFDKENGDFSKPIYSIPSDNLGIATGLAVSHKVMNTIGRLAGIESSEQGTIKWTVVSSRGISKVTSKQIRKLTFTRFGGIDAPDALYLTGEGTEGGTDLALALAVKALPGGDEFEVYTKLLAGKKYKFVDSRTNVTRTFSVDKTALKEIAEGATVAKDGIYKITLNFAVGNVSFQEISNLDFYMCTPKKRTNLTYQGKGVWKAANLVPDFISGGFGDDRYFFFMTINGVERKIGSRNEDNIPPTVKTGSYFNTYFYPDDNNQWRYSFKFPNRSVTKCNVVLSLSADLADYSHEIVY